MMMSQLMGGAHGGRAVPILDQIRAELDRGREAADNLHNLYSLLPEIFEVSTGDQSRSHDKPTKTGRKSVSDGAGFDLQNNTMKENNNTKGISGACEKRDSVEPNDIYDGEISLGTKPNVPAEYESRCVHETQLQAKDASLQEALNEIAKLKSRNNRLETAMMETRKNAYEAEEKARIKGQDLTVAKKAIINNNAQIKNLERRNAELSMMLSDNVDKLEKTHEELTAWKTKYANDYDEAVRLGNIHRKLGADLFYQMTQLEVIVANGCGIFFFSEQDKELKARACLHLTLDLAYTTTQTDLYELSKECNANDDVPSEKWTAVGGLRLAIEAPPKKDETDEFTRLLNSKMEKPPHVIDQETHVVDDSEYLEPTTPEKLTADTNLRSVSGETSLSSPTGSSSSEAGRPDSATSNEFEQGSSMCEDSGAGSIVMPEVEASSNDEGEKLRSLLGYNPNPEEPFYPQYEKASELPVSNESVEETFEVQEPQSPNEAMEIPLTTCYESNTGPEVQWLLGYNPKPEEPFYPQYSQHHEKEKDSTSLTPIQQDQEQTSVTIPENEPIFDIKPEEQTTATTTTDSEPLPVDVSFADTSKNFKEEIAIRMEQQDTSSTDSTELEQKETTSPIFTPQVSSSSPTTTSPAPSSRSIAMPSPTTSHPFNPSSKPRLSRAQRREAALKSQDEAMMASKQKAEARAAEEKGEKMSRQERRAAERKAWKAALKQPRRNIVRF